MVIPQVYDSVVGLVQAIPDYIEVVQVWLQTFFEDNPDIQDSILPVYNSAATSLEQWLNSDILPNLESVTTTFKWLRQTILPNITGVVAGVSGMVVGLLVLVKDLLIALGGGVVDPLPEDAPFFVTRFLKFFAWAELH